MVFAARASPVVWHLLKPGKYHVTFVKPGYVTNTVIVDFLRVKMQSVRVLMAEV